MQFMIEGRSQVHDNTAQTGESLPSLHEDAQPQRPIVIIRSPRGPITKTQHPPPLGGRQQPIILEPISSQYSPTPRGTKRGTKRGLHTDALGTVPEDRVCDTAQKRQDLCLSMEKMLAITGSSKDLDQEKLPVVDLLPFTKKQWRPQKSVPDYYEPIPPPQVNRSNSTLGFSSGTSVNNNRRVDFESYGYPNPTKESTITPRNDPCPRAKSVGGFSSRVHPIQREHTITGAFEIEPTNGGSSSFITKLERQKSTLDGITTGTSFPAQFSCNKRSLTEHNLLEQSNINVKGRRYDSLPARPLNLIYCKPWEYYKLTRSLTAAPKEQSPQNMIDNMYARLENIENLYLDECIYDSFDRSKTLPSLKVKPAKMKKRSVQRNERAHSGRSNDGVRLGVTNSLDIMSHLGRPLGIEQHITTELKHTLENIRRAKENTSFVCGTSKMTTSAGIICTPTQGEANIYDSYVQNGTRSVMSRSSKSQRTTRGVSRATTYMKSDYIDSGIESLGGNDARGSSPSKSMHRMASSKNMGGDLTEVPNESPGMHTEVRTPKSAGGILKSHSGREQQVKFQQDTGHNTHENTPKANDVVKESPSDNTLAEPEATPDTRIQTGDLGGKDTDRDSGAEDTLHIEPSTISSEPPTEVPHTTPADTPKTVRTAVVIPHSARDSSDAIVSPGIEGEKTQETDNRGLDSA